MASPAEETEDVEVLLVLRGDRDLVRRVVDVAEMAQACGATVTYARPSVIGPRKSVGPLPEMPPIDV